jgi:hypothetical protein
MFRRYQWSNIGECVVIADCDEAEIHKGSFSRMESLLEFCAEATHHEAYITSLLAHAHDTHILTASELSKRIKTQTSQKNPIFQGPFSP